MKILLLLSFFILTPPAALAAQPGTYDYGMEQRKKGDYAGAKETFLEMQRLNPESGGALEGLALACLSLGQYAEARQALEKWNAASPNNPYILGLLLRAQNALKDEAAVLLTYKAIVAADPRDCQMRSRLDSAMQRLAGGVFPWARTYRSHSMEGLDTSSPQRILYEGSSAGGEAALRLKPGLDLLAGVTVREEAQRNEGGGFTYYDILEQIYTVGLRGRPAPDLGWEAGYGVSVLSDVKAAAVGNRTMDRLRLSGSWDTGAARLRAYLASAPKFVRGSGTTQYFKLMRESSARLEAERGLFGWDMLARGGVYATSDGSATGSASLRGVREFGRNVLRAGYSHDTQEFYGASAAGRLQYVYQDSVSAGLAHTVEEKYRAAASGAQTWYADSNRLAELNADLTLWLPWQKEFYAVYRFSLQDFLEPRPGYNSTDNSSNWLGAYWRRCHGKNWSALLGYERGFLDDSRGSYSGNVYLGELDWFRGSGFSMHLQGRTRNTSVKDRSYSAGLQARYSF